MSSTPIAQVGKPVLIGGSDNTYLQPIYVDADGRQHIIVDQSNALYSCQVAGLTPAGQLIQGNPVPIAYQDQNGNAVIPSVNQNVTALVSATRTATTDSLDFLNVNSRGLILYLNVSAASGTGGIQIVVQAKDPYSGNYQSIVTLPSAVTGTGLKVYAYYPGASSAGGYTAINSVPLPRQFRIHSVHGDSSSYTYSATFDLLN